MPDRHIAFLLPLSPNDCFLCDDSAISSLWPLSGMTGTSLHFSALCKWNVGSACESCRTHQRKRNRAPAACASALQCGQKGRRGNDLFPLLLPVSPHCQWAAQALSDFPISQRGCKSSRTRIEAPWDSKPSSGGDFPVLARFLATLRSTAFPREEKKVGFLSRSVLSHQQSSKMLPVLLKSSCFRYWHCTTTLW